MLYLHASATNTSLLIQRVLGVSAILLSSSSVWAAPISGAPVLSLSPYMLFIHADLVVKSVIILLLIMSLLSWIIWASKVFEFKRKHKDIVASIHRIESKSLIDAEERIPDEASLLIYNVGYDEYVKAKDKQVVPEHNIKERASAQIERIISNEKHRLSNGAVFLATVGAIAPFVGLLGTVWGIMHSFVSIAQSNVTSLSVVAPGIAEALFATALGLFAAIPALILYNQVVRHITRHGLFIEDVATVVLCLLSISLDHIQEGKPQKLLREA